MHPKFSFAKPLDNRRRKRYNTNASRAAVTAKSEGIADHILTTTKILTTYSDHRQTRSIWRQDRKKVSIKTIEWLRNNINKIH